MTTPAPQNAPQTAPETTPATLHCSRLRKGALTWK